MGKSGNRVGIFGGSFNPVHFGHLELASYALSELNLDEVIFVPSFQTPLKDPKKLFPVDTRLACLKAALQGKHPFTISEYEVLKKGISYTVDTLKHFRKKFSQKTTLYFLAGADTAKNLSRWKSPDKVLKLCRFAVFSRPGESLEGVRPDLIRVPFPALDISSSEARKLFWSGKKISHLVPLKVEQELTKFKRKAVLSSKPRKKSR